MSDIPVLLVSATRGSEELFREMPLGLSLGSLMACKRLKPAIVVDNKDGLPRVYNSFISEMIRDAFVVFVHDDVWIDDFFLVDRLQAALSEFDIVGVVGNTRPHPNNAPAWHVTPEGEMDKDYLSGGICLCKDEFDPRHHIFNHFGPPPAAVSLLDGVFIAARGNALLNSGVRFDERFDFHFYDLDFARTANQAGLRVGTWPIPVTHIRRHFDGYDTKEWRKNHGVYFDKWLGPDYMSARPPLAKEHAS